MAAAEVVMLLLTRRRCRQRDVSRGVSDLAQQRQVSRDQMDGSPFPAVAEATVSAVLLSGQPSPAAAVKVSVPPGWSSRGRRRCRSRACRQDERVCRHGRVELATGAAASRVTIPGSAVKKLSRRAAHCMLRSMSPFQVTSMFRPTRRSGSTLLGGPR